MFDTFGKSDGTQPQKPGTLKKLERMKKNAEPSGAGPRSNQ